tara:strand:- start:1103 stop:1525 length:423 start_codon:yes stop_codon:yes gene_type:complete
MEEEQQMVPEVNEEEVTPSVSKTSKKSPKATSKGKTFIGPDGTHYPSKVGSRARVYHKQAYKTTGHLTKKDLVKNSSGRIVSRKRQIVQGKLNNLGKHLRNKGDSTFGSKINKPGKTTAGISKKLKRKSKRKSKTKRSKK